MNINFIIFISIAFCFGVTISFIFYFFARQRFASEIEKNDFILQKANFELENLNEKNEILFNQIKDFEKSIENYVVEKKYLEFENQKLREDFIKQESISNHMNENLKKLEERLIKSENEKNNLEFINSDINCKLASIESQKKTLEESLKFMNDSLLHQFKNIAINVMNENSEKFTKESKEKIDVLINPLHEKLQNFQKNMQECFDIEAKEKFSLKDSISKVIHSNEQIKYEASKLSNALKGNKMALGHWGEIVLENLLVSSGLRKDQDYFLQTNMQNN